MRLLLIVLAITLFAACGGDGGSDKATRAVPLVTTAPALTVVASTMAATATSAAQSTIVPTETAVPPTSVPATPTASPTVEPSATPTTPANTPTAAAPEESASQAAERLFGYIELAQHGRRWEMLHPVQQAIVSRDAYINCNQPISLPISGSKAVDEFDETVTVARVGEIPTRAVTMEYTSGGSVDHITIHLIDVDGEWRWTMPEEDIAAYEAGQCPR